MDRMILKFATLSAQEIPKLKSLASFKILTFKDLKAAKMALATKEDAEPVLRLAKLMGLISSSCTEARAHRSDTRKYGARQ
jgi:hypothetical protein